MKQKCIFHVDVNSAFLSWTAVKRLREDPQAVDLRRIPSAVGGDIRTRHGIITAKSIEAKKYGVRTGEPVTKALEKCPKLVLVPADFQTYREYSRKFIGVLHHYSDLVEQVSIDEAYMDVTERISEGGKTEGEKPPYERAAVALAGQIKDEIRDTLGFTVNVGISSNKLLAKTASDFEKPDRIHVLWPSDIPEKFWPLPIEELHGCGHATAGRLMSIGIHTVGDAAHTDKKVLESLLGEKAGEYIHNSTNGIGSDRVHSDRGEAKSYSNETTLAEDVTEDNFYELGAGTIRHLSEKVAERLKKDGIYGQIVTLSVKTDDFRRHSRQMGLQSAVNDAGEIERAAMSLAEQLLRGGSGLFEKGRSVRLIGVGVSKLDHGEYRQISLFDIERENRARTQEKRQKDLQKQKEEARRRKRELQLKKRRELEDMMNRITDKYGKNAVSRGIHQKDQV